MTAVSNIQIKRPWQNIVVLSLGFWLSSSLILDWVIMPSLYVSGMMTQTGFATAGYSIFWNFNRIELIAAAIVLTSILVLSNTEVATNWRRAMILSLVLLAIPLIDTYFLTPQMCATGIELDLFNPAIVPPTMNQLHVGYWVLEAAKLITGGTLLSWCLRR